MKKCLKTKGLRSPLKSQTEYNRVENICKIKNKQIYFHSWWKEALTEKQDESYNKLKFKNNKIYHDLFASCFNLLH